MSTYIKDGVWTVLGERVCDADVSPANVRQLIECTEWDIAEATCKQENLYAVLRMIEKV